MRTESPVRAAPERTCREGVAAPRVWGVRTAPLLDVMMEQIEYLAGHGAGACPAECADCARLNQVKRWLLAPFQ